MFPSASAAMPSGCPGWPSGNVAKRLTPRSAVAGSESAKSAARAKTATSAMSLRMSLPLRILSRLLSTPAWRERQCASALPAQVIEDLSHHSAIDLVIAADLLHDWRFREGSTSRAAVGGRSPRARHRAGTVSESFSPRGLDEPVRPHRACDRFKAERERAFDHDRLRAEHPAEQVVPRESGPAAVGMTRPR